MPPRLRLVRPDEAQAGASEPVPQDSLPAPVPQDSSTARPSVDATPPVPQDSSAARPSVDATSPVPQDSPRARPPLDPVPPVPQDSPRARPPLDPVPPVPRARPPADAPPPVLADSLPLRLTLAPPPVARVVAPAAALAELDALLAADLDDLACARLAALAALVPGRLRAITTALGQVASSAAVVALRSLPPGAPGQLDALLRCFALGVPRRAPVLAASPTPPVPTDSPTPPGPADSPTPPGPADSPTPPGPADSPTPPGPAASPNPPVPADSPAPPVPTDRLLLALEFRSSRARGFPDLVARAQALAARGPAAEFAALDVDARRHYRLAYHAGRCPPAALAAQLRAAHLDLAWLHARLLRLRGSRLWLGGWRFDVDDPLGPAAQGHLLQAWLRWAERGPA